MHKPLALLHACFAAIWLGCVLTEIVFERVLLAEGITAHRSLARLHVLVDFVIEIPAMIGVIVTGAALVISGPALDTLLLGKIIVAVVALVANFVCVLLVIRRNVAARRGDLQEFALADRLQHGTGAIVLVGLVGAASLAFFRL